MLEENSAKPLPDLIDSMKPSLIIIFLAYFERHCISTGFKRVYFNMIDENKSTNSSVMNKIEPSPHMQ
jgi:hypothetical protein